MFLIWKNGQSVCGILKIMMELEKIHLNLTIATSMASDILPGLSKALDNF